MERYVFEIPTDEGLRETVIESIGECYSVHMNGHFVGSMWWEENKGLQWNTGDVELTPFIWDIASMLSEAFTRNGFPSILKGTYSEIIATTWKSAEMLEVVVSADSDLEVFTVFLKDEILNLVNFEEHLDLMVRKADSTYFIIMGIN
ncbi:hypothetical protein [Pedobacter sp. UBA5917]|jgi:Cdc6-like AAA superfamily ATPase|uniref:hypothetical protein n=1 Tax=Pedobacter sp. UBA5917 TaxID=1947061 RepID=UPI0025F6133C|nr:hypothetical protein [Pedobacter sp. UBA5917]